MIRKAIHGLLSADTEITTRLATYRFGDGDGETLPAIFTTSGIPNDAAYPAILITHVGGVPFGTRGARGADFNVDITIYDDRDMSGAALDELAMQIWKRCDRADLSTYLAGTGYEDCGCLADPPANHGDADSFPGYLIRVRAQVLES